MSRHWLGGRIAVLTVLSGCLAALVLSWLGEVPAPTPTVPSAPTLHRAQEKRIGMTARIDRDGKDKPVDSFVGVGEAVGLF